MTSVTICAVAWASTRASEIERRFLLAGVPDGAEVLAVDEIDDRYLDGTRLRLRRMAQVGGPTELKLTQKLPEPDGRGRQGALTTIYLSRGRARRARRPARRRAVQVAPEHRPYGVDVFARRTSKGSMLAEVEFGSVAGGRRVLVPAAFCHAEVTADRRFTGGELVRATRAQVRAWAAEYGVELARR